MIITEEKMNRLIRVFVLLSVYFFLPIHFLVALPHDWPENKIIVLPEMGNSPILSAIKSAKKSIDFALYHLDDSSIIDALIKSKKDGVNVRVTLNKPNLYPSPFETKINEATAKTLSKNDIKIHFLEDHK
ncbi:MAG: hypothetical protein K2W92_10325 [Alphaproteobacteria bacterium]|nr:hypothetical protein [Alphaproteobacteria bacterium]